MEGTSVIAVDLGATHYRAALVTADGCVSGFVQGDTPREGVSGEVVTRAVGDAVASVLGQSRAAAIGVASAGPLDLVGGRVVCSPNMAFDEVPLVGPLSERFGLPVRLLNDCRAGALGERWRGAAQGVDDLVYLTLSTGIGGGAVVGGRLLLGRDGNAGEVGHLFVDAGYALPCGCGHRGHWEAYASGTGMPRFFAAWLAKKNLQNPSFDTSSSRGILGAAARGDPLAGAFMDALGEINARALSDIIIAYSPEMIVLDGPIAQAHGDLLIRHIVPHLDRYLPTPAIMVSPLGGRAPLLGAAAYALGLR
ncbi:ROK family protein [Methanofollis formosanus]|uniref:ROK family protein n=1 Tax=Methanofollis formosanus TaxID=299308 RepID=A0A8G1A121_9EURY|nr:ROK family protein [Methanofollis formosanus]QYZ79222.1 ROK family protein [Methanofollis formosanus]